MRYRSSCTLMVGFVALVLGTSATATERPFRLASEDGKSWVQPGALHNKPSVFLFWDTECTPCLQELQHLDRLQASFPDAVLVAVSLSPRADTRRVLGKLQLPASVILARGPTTPQGLLASLGNRFGSLPFTAAFDKDGTPCTQHLGGLTTEVMTHAAQLCRYCLMRDA